MESQGTEEAAAILKNERKMNRDRNRAHRQQDRRVMSEIRAVEEAGGQLTPEQQAYKSRNIRRSQEKDEAVHRRYWGMKVRTLDDWEKMDSETQKYLFRNLGVVGDRPFPLTRDEDWVDDEVLTSPGEWPDPYIPHGLRTVANTGTGTSGSFAGVTAVSGAVVCPAQSASTRYVQLTDLATTGATANDGYGEWTVEARMKTTAVGNVNNFGIFFVGDDYAGSANGARVSLYCSANANLYIVTEDLGKTDRLLRIPFTYLEALTSAGNRPTNGAYHKYRLLRKTYTGAVEGLSDARNLFQLWYDDVEVNLQTGQNGVTLPDSVLQNPQIKVANSYLRIGGTTRQQSAQEVTYDYVPFARMRATVGGGLYQFGYRE
eukprot:jgi/Mesvir1/26572/Mv16226-RA.1